MGERCGHCYPYVASSIWVKWAKEKEPQHMAIISLRHCDKPATEEEVHSTITVAGVTSDLIVRNCKEHSLAVRALEGDRLKPVKEEKKTHIEFVQYPEDTR